MPEQDRPARAPSPSAWPAKSSDLIGEPTEEILQISGKTGEGVAEVLEELIARVPPPSGDPEAPPRALIFDSEFDQYRGVIAYIRVVDGVFKKGEAIRAMATGDGGGHRRHRLLQPADDADGPAGGGRGRAT